MNLNRTFIGVVLDRSGSMASICDDTIGGFNTFLKEQKALPGEADLTLVLFDHDYIVLHDCVKLADVPELDNRTFVPRGNTALLDAIGRTISAMKAKLAEFTDEERPGKVVLVITTDGLENNSREFQPHQIQDMLKEVQEKGGWEVIYFGANQNAISVGTSMGVTAGSSFNYQANSVGTRGAYRQMSEHLSMTRTLKPEDAAKLKEAIQKNDKDDKLKMTLRVDDTDNT